MSRSDDVFDGIAEEKVDRNIWLNKGVFQDIKDLNSCSLLELDKILGNSQCVAVYLCWEVMNSVTLHAVAGTESVAKYYSKIIRDMYEHRNLPCKVKIDRVIVNHFFASTMVDYAVHDPTYIKIREDFQEMKEYEEKDKMDVDQARRIIDWGKAKGYIPEKGEG